MKRLGKKKKSCLKMNPLWKYNLVSMSGWAQWCKSSVSRVKNHVKGVLLTGAFEFTARKKKKKNMPAGEELTEPGFCRDQSELWRQIIHVGEKNLYTTSTVSKCLIHTQ